MSTQNSTGTKDFTITGTSLSAWRIVEIQSDGTVGYTTATGQSGIGVLQADGSSTYLAGHVPVRLWTNPGTIMVSITGQPITAGNTLYATTSGQATPTSATGSVAIGKALDSSTTNGDIIEILSIN